MASYDYNRVQRGKSDIDREAYPVMYDPENGQWMKEVEVLSTATIELKGKGTPTEKLYGNVRLEGLDNRIKIKVGSEGNVKLTGDGTAENPLNANIVIPEDYIQAVEDTDSIHLNVDGSSKLTADLKIDNSGNVELSVTDNGLKGYVDFPLDTLSSDNPIDIRTEKVGDHDEHIVSLDVSEDEDNLLTVEDDGLKASLATDKDSVHNVWFDGTGTPGSPLKGNVELPTVDGSDSINISASGLAYSVSAKISEMADNMISVEEDGLYVPPTEIPEVPVKSLDGGDGIEITDNGNGDFTIGAKVSEDARNILDVGTDDGLYVGAELPEGGLPGQILKISPSGVPEWDEEVDPPVMDIADTDTVDLSLNNGVLSADVKISEKGDNQTDPVNALEEESDGLWTPTLYLGPFASSARPSNAITGQYIFDTDLGYCLYRNGGAWVNSTGAIIEGNVEPSEEVVEWIANPMTSYGDLIVGGPSGTPMRFGVGAERQELVVDNGQLAWKDKPRSCQENYSIINSTNVEDADAFKGKLFVSKIVCNHDGIYSELGFALKSGTIGKVGMAVYDMNHALVARTELFSANQSTSGYTYWHETESEYVLHAGTEYFLAIWFGNDPNTNLLKVFAKEVENTPDSSLCGCVYGQQSITEMPSTLDELSLGDTVFHMSAR